MKMLRSGKLALILSSVSKSLPSAKNAILADRGFVVNGASLRMRESLNGTSRMTTPFFSACFALLRILNPIVFHQ